MEAETFIPCLKRFIARRGRPRIIYSDNGGTFVKIAKWISKLRKDESVRGLLKKYEITWKFNLSRAPWWGGQFERLIEIVKLAMYKVIGNATLSFDELAEVLLDVETQVNRRPLSYVEDDTEFPVLTPSTFLHQRTSQLPEEESWRVEQDLRKRDKSLKSCKEGLWRRWQREYLTALRERHNLTHRVSKFQPKEGDVVTVKGDSKNRGTWLLGIVTRIFVGTDGVTRGVQLRTGKGTLERPVQLLHPLELACEVKSEVKETTLNPKATAFRPQRAAAATANARIAQITEIEDNT